MISLYAATRRGLVHLQVDEDGPAEAALLLREPRLQCVAAAPDGAPVVYAGTRGRGVFKTSDGGQTWHDAKLPEADVFSLAVSPADGAVYAGTEPSRLFKSDNRGRSWRELEGLQDIPSRPTWSFPPRPETSHVRWIAPSPHDANLVILGIELGGLMRSTDGGVSWSDHRPGAQKDVHCLAWHPTVRGRAYEAGGGGAAWSRDGGATWRAADRGRSRHYTWGLAVDPVDPDTWYVSASPGPRQAHTKGNAQAAVYRWHGDGPWKPLAGGLPDPLAHFPYALLCSGEWLFAGLGSGQLYASRDRGDTWRLLEVHGASLQGLRGLVMSP